jgi:hypothetical protein
MFIGQPSNVITRSKLNPQRLLNISLGQPPLILLRGYDLVQAAEAMALILYWESLAPISMDLSTFAQLRRQTGQIIAQKDGPTGGVYLTSFWQPGEIVADKVVISLKHLPREPSNLYLGLYDLTTGQRLVVPENPANEILLLSWP